MRCWNLPDMHCVAGVKAVQSVSEPNCRALCCRGAGCLCGVRIYLLGTVLQRCRLFMRCWNLSAGHCVAGMQAVEAVSESTCRSLCCRGAGCLYCVRIYLPGTVLQAVYTVLESTCQALC